MSERGTGPAAPILMRAYKMESEIEVWKLNRSGRYVLLKSFPVCRWSGKLGPKSRTGDRQTPEGFYAIAPKQMNPNSAYYLSFDTGFPNEYDRAQGATGSYLMVHGTCSSAGCFAMTDKGIAELYAIAREAFAGGQRAFQFQSFPFRMTARNIARHRGDPNIAFWRKLKEGSDRFEATGEELKVAVAGKQYSFAAHKNPTIEAQAKARVSDEAKRVAELIEEGAASVRTTYADGGQHPSFTQLMRRGVALGEISRPEALAMAGRELVLIPARKPKPEVPVMLADIRPVQVAFGLMGPVGQKPVAGTGGADAGLAIFTMPDATEAPAQSRIALAYQSVADEPALMKMAALSAAAPVDFIVAAR